MTIGMRWNSTKDNNSLLSNYLFQRFSIWKLMNQSAFLFTGFASWISTFLLLFLCNFSWLLVGYLLYFNLTNVGDDKFKWLFWFIFSLLLLCSMKILTSSEMKCTWWPFFLLNLVNNDFFMPDYYHYFKLLLRFNPGVYWYFFLTISALF